MFKDRLRELRLSYGYSMDELAEQYNLRFNGKMNKSTLSRYENGLQEPMIYVARNLATLLGVSVDYLTEEDAEQKDKSDPHSETRLAHMLTTRPLLRELVEVLSQLDDEHLRAFALTVGAPIGDKRQRQDS